MLKPLCVLYAHVGRVADARAAIGRSQSIFTGFGAKLALQESAIPAAITSLIIGDPAAAERYARKGYESCRAMGQHAVCPMARHDSASLPRVALGGGRVSDDQARYGGRDGAFLPTRVSRRSR